MASGPAAPLARPARSRPVAAARPGALLTAAAAVPLGAAVLYASGLLDWVPRLLLGAALVVLGTAIWRTEGTITGARIGPRTSRAIGMAVVVGGAVVIGGALVAAVGDRNAGADWAPLLLCGALGAAGTWIARERPAIGGVVAAVGVAAGWLLLLAVLDVGEDLENALTVLPALGLTLVAIRGSGSPAVRAGLGTAAATLIIANTGEITGISGVLNGLVLSAGSLERSVGWSVAPTVVSQLVLGALLATAFVRRDPVGGALATAALLSRNFSDDGTLRIAQAVIPAIALALLSVAARSEDLRGWLTARAPEALRDRGWIVSADVVRGAWAVSLVIFVASVSIADSRVQAAFAVVALLAATWAAWTSRGTSATAAAAVTLVGWATIRPVAVLLGDESWAAVGVDDNGTPFRLLESNAGAFVELAVVALVALVLLARHRTPAVMAAAVTAVITAGAAAILFGISSDGRLLRIVVGSLALPVVPLVVAAGCAAAGPSRWLAHAQAVAAVSAGLAMVGLFSLPFSVLGSAFAVDEGLSDAARLVLVLLLVGIAFGGALLAASTARRSSTVAALGAVAAAVGTATLAATLSAALAAPTAALDAVDAFDPNNEVFVPLAPALGFDWHGGLLRLADGAWPVLFGIVGLVLLGAAAWLERRRPLPAGAPVAPRDDD